MSIHRLIIFVATVLIIPHGAAADDFAVNIESGGAFGGYNDVRIPGTTGTEFSLTGDLSTDLAPFLRFRLTFTPAPQHTLSLLIAPLRLHAEGRIDRDILFETARFPAETFLEATYRFDSYRVTYRYGLHRSADLQLGLGVTAKLRDAAVQVEGGGTREEKKNTGFVPLINFHFLWAVRSRIEILLTGDALAAPQGRAEDILIALQYRVNRRIAARAGYRILEGGADVDEVYNFALIHYLVVGAEITF